MHLRDLDPKFVGTNDNGLLRFDCPNENCEFGRHSIRLHVGAHTPWTATGEYPNLTIHPSVDAGCWHGWIRNGEIVTV